jgi:hypothetical protein
MDWRFSCAAHRAYLSLDVHLNEAHEPVSRHFAAVYLQANSFAQPFIENQCRIAFLLPPNISQGRSRQPPHVVAAHRLVRTVLSRTMKHQDHSLDPVSRNQKTTLVSKPISTNELGTTLSERSHTSRHVQAIEVVDVQMALEELIDFLLKSPIRTSDHKRRRPLGVPLPLRLEDLHDLQSLIQ